MSKNFFGAETDTPSIQNRDKSSKINQQNNHQAN
jgi:hypothetical protein